MTTLSTHVLDTAFGKPAQGVRVTLEFGGAIIGMEVTDADGRVKEMVKKGFELQDGDYRLTFFVGDYFAQTKRDSFYNDVVVNFRITDVDQHYHVPLLISPFGYSTYRGS